MTEEHGDAFEGSPIIRGSDKAQQQVREGFDRYYSTEKPAIPPSPKAPYTFQQVKDWRFNGTPLPKREREIEKVISYLKEQTEDPAIDHEAQNKLDAALYPDLPLIEEDAPRPLFDDKGKSTLDPNRKHPELPF